MSSFSLPSVTVASRSHLYNKYHHHHHHHLNTLFTAFLLFLISPCHAYSSGGSGLPVFIKLIFIFFGVLFLVVFLIIIRRILAMRRIAANGGGVVHYQNAQPTAQIVVQARRPQPPPPNGFVTTISTGNVTTTQPYSPQNSQIGFVYPQNDNGQMILSSQAFSPESVYFPAPHQSPPAPGFSLPGAPPPYYPVAPPDHQSYSK